MTDFVWPTGVRISSCDWRPISNSRSSPDTFDSGQQTATRPGDKLGCTVRVNNSSGAERAKLRALASLLRGRANRCFLPDYAFTRRGSFPAPELFTNSDFSNGTNGWPAAAELTMLASDGVMKATVNAVTGAVLGFSQNPTLTANTPHTVRTLVLDGAQSAGLTIGPDIYNVAGTVFASDFSTSRGYRLATLVSDAAGASASAAVNLVSVSGYTAGASFLVPFISAARSALVDGGGNSLLRSNDIDVGATWINTACSVGSNLATAPDGTATAETIIENSANTDHFVYQTITRTSEVVDYAAVGAFGRVAGTRDVAFYLDDGAGSGAFIQVNLSTGSVISAATTYGSATNARGYVVSLGNGWWRLHLIARLPATTSVKVIAYMANAGTTTYLGNGSSSIKAWGLGVKRDSLPTRQTQTITVAVAASSQTGAGIYVKGLPASTNGLLLTGDLVEINKIIYPLASDLNSDAAGLGYLQLAFPPPRAITDNTPVIICKPMGRMIMMNDPEIPCVPGGFSDFEFNFVQDLAA